MVGTIDREEMYRKALEERDAFVVELGHLTLAWSDLETVLFHLLKYYAGVSDAVGRALFSGTRARNAIAFIRAIADNTAMDSARRGDLEDIFAQIGAINSMRDFIVHNVDGSRQEFEPSDPQQRYVSDEIRSSRKSKVKTVLIGSASLIAMRNDCIEACWRLHAHWDPKNLPFTPGPGIGGKRSPWQFVPPQPTQKS